MCGIAGLWRLGAESALDRDVRRMCATLAHRGPDGDGFWLDDETGIALGHRRLAIVDLSENGSQPMASHCGRFVITYNGELYNTQDIRDELMPRGIHFRGTSDTEVLVNAVATWGIEEATRRMNGIFAFAIWDRECHTLHLVRDRVGVKPLFYATLNNGLGFASELRALATLPSLDRTLDIAAIGSLVTYNYIRAPKTIYRSIRAVEPGTILSLEATGGRHVSTYWSLPQVVRDRASERARPRDAREAIDELEALLRDAVSRQLVSDVPIGAFLSGGIDSSTVASLMQSLSSKPVRTFSIGFESRALDEAVAAKAVASHLGTEHRELYVTDRELLDCITDLPTIYDQPLADPSGVPMFLLSRMARRDVTVALSGDGGDELFHGYTRYFTAAAARHRVTSVPSVFRGAARIGANALGAAGFRETGFRHGGRILRNSWHAARLIEHAGGDLDDCYLPFMLHWSNPAVVAPGAVPDLDLWQSCKMATGNFPELMMLNDALGFMVDYVLAKVDRASMAVSLEARVPLLDHRVIEHAWSLPHDLKMRDGAGKWCLRQVLYRYVPQALVDRPKSGFAAPLGTWLRGPLRDWAEHLLSDTTLSKWGVLTSRPVRRLWNAHVAGKVDGSSHLWSLIMLQAWLETVHAVSAAEDSPSIERIV